MTAPTSTEVLDREIRPHLGRALRRLEEWTGEFGASTPGAAPPSTPAPVVDPDADEARLTKVEADALAPDFARRLLADADRLLGEMRALAESSGLPHTPVPRTVAADLAAAAWLTTPHRLRALDGHTRARVDQIVGHLAHVVAHAQPAASVKPLTVCHAHEKAGDRHEPVDARYRGLELCRWCGEFRALHGVHPPPELIRLHARGIRITTTHLRRAGIKVKSA